MTRIFDIMFSSLALIVLSPILCAIILILRCTGEGEVFYWQTRVGLVNKKIRILKFATMYKVSESIGTGTITLKNDPRILPVGKFLRKSKFNEIPQLFNILIGEMSLIGPRPQTQRCFDAFPQKYKENLTSVVVLIFAK